ncbi:MAG: hypothetical protein Q4Q04_02765 [Methanocorpusculum sp.]|nr:hypothetical protein [Methanocorpusculum sp.]
MSDSYLHTKKPARRIIVLLVLLALAVLLSAGCITTEPAVKTTAAETPEDMQEGLNAFSETLTSLARTIVADLNSLSEQMEAAESDAELEKIARGYYAENPWLVAVIFRDAADDKYWSVPIFIDDDLSAYSANPTESDFRKAEGFIIRNCVFTENHGYLNLYYKPVYRTDGTYHGYLVFAADIYSALNLHPLVLGKEMAYGNFAPVITDKNGLILYSSIEEAIGQKIPDNGAYYDGQMYIPDVKAGNGACTYTSRSFYNYDSETQTEKITAWQWVYSSNGGEYIIYLVKELNQPELQMKNCYQDTTKQALADVRDAYLYASTEGKNKLIERIGSGYYSTPLYILDMHGAVVAASSHEPVGINYLNNRGVYGYSYTNAAILAAEQGGGYIYHTYPVERVADPKALQYSLGISMPIDGDCFLYGRFAGSTDAILKDDNLRTDVTRVSRAVMKEAGETGVDAVAARINANPEAGAELFAANLTTEIKDIAILDIKGYVYASIYYPETVGYSSTGIKDVYGGSVTRRAIMLAKTGSGFMTNLTPNPEKDGYVDLWLVSIEPVDETYYIYTAAVIGTFEDLLTPYLD